MQTISLTNLFKRYNTAALRSEQLDRIKRNHAKLNRLFQETPLLSITDEDRIVVFSDLHLGNGSSKDDFLPNSDFFETILEQYYLSNGYKLILNGDIEELQRFQLKDITKRWERIYNLFHKFQERQGFFKIIGNHDQELQAKKVPSVNGHHLSALKLNYNGDTLFIFHGHQASFFIERFNSLCRFILRYIANPFGIKNFSFSHDRRIRFRTEQKVYYYSRDKKIVSLIGHTHRPLFESLSKVDFLKFKIEQLCREYSKAKPETQPKLAKKIELYNRELKQHLIRHKQDALKSSLYDANLLVPCLFNSGCVIGKSGITAIEISGGNITLVYWFDRRRSQKYFDFNGYQPEQFNNSDYFRLTLNEDNLKYIFARINLLA